MAQLNGNCHMLKALQRWQTDYEQLKEGKRERVSEWNGELATEKARNTEFCDFQLNHRLKSYYIWTYQMCVSF